MKTYKELTDLSYSKADYIYQPELTKKLDKSNGWPIDQNLINEIVLWKTNRYVQLNNETLSILNALDIRDNILDEPLTRKVLQQLLKTRGIRLPMASAILRFRNATIYQIIDQRAYRFVYGKELKVSGLCNDKAIEADIQLYLQYLKELQKVGTETGWPFSELDRILYQLDQEYNKGESIRY